MKLHLPKVLFAAVVAAVCCVVPAEAATYYLNAADTSESTNISASFTETSGGEAKATDSYFWKKFCSGQGINYDGPHQLVIEQARTEGNKIKIDFAPFCVTGINVTSGATNNYIYRDSSNDHIIFGNGANGAGEQSSSFAENFTLEHRGAGSIQLVGTQTWSITDGKTVSLNGKVLNTGTSTISGGALSISTYDADSPGTLTNNGTLTVDSALSVADSIVNNGSLTLNASLTITASTDAMKYDVAGGSLSEETHGYRTGEATYYVTSGTGTAELGSGFSLTVGGNAVSNYAIVNGQLAINEGTATSTIYEISADYTGETITYDGTEGSATHGATGFKVAGGQALNVAAAVGADGIMLAGEDVNLNLSNNVTLNSSQLTVDAAGANANIDIDGATFQINEGGAVSKIKSIDMKNGAKTIITAGNTTLGSADDLVEVSLTGGATLAFRNGNSGARNYLDITVNGEGTLAGSYQYSYAQVDGNIKGNGTLTITNEPDKTNGWSLNSMVSDAADGKLAVVINAANAFSITGANTYSGGTTISNGTVTAGNASALGTGKVTMNGGTLTQSTDLSILAMDYTGGTVNNNGKALAVTGTLAAKADMSIAGSGTTSIGTLDLSTGNSFSTEGSITLGTLVLDLGNYSDMEQTYTLVTATGEGAIVTLTNNYTAMVGEYSVVVSGSGTNTLSLSFTEYVEPVTALTTTVTDAAYVDGMLTLTVAGDITADTETALITGFDNGVLDKIFSLDGISANTMVGITLVDSDTGSIVADADQLVGFQGKYGVYYGEQVGSAGWQYNVSYIPEPTTATLSLLALAGLAARRRRK